MATNPADIQLESALISSKMIGAQQMQDAKEELERRVLMGESITLADILVSRGIITDSIRKNFEKSNQDPPKGQQTLGHYQLLRKLGQGGMGAVYLAEDSADKSKVAVKVLPEKFANDPELLARFRRETKAAFRLRHENIAAAFGEGEQNGVSYYTMEYCDGEPLDIAQKRAGAMPLGRALEILIQIARGLKYAHENGIIHRDIKPANIFLTKGGVVKILDMGLSKDIEADELSYNTTSGAVLGTAHYLSPEQAKGEKKIDGRADIYSLGATLYSLVTGTTPFKGATQAMVMMKHITEELPDPRTIVKDLPESANQLIQKMMAKNPDDRFQNCGEVIQEIEKVQATLPKVAPKPPEVAAALPDDDTQTGVKRPVKAGAPATHVVAPATAIAANPAIVVAEMAASVPEIKHAAAEPAPMPKSRAPMIAAAVIFLSLLGIGIWYAIHGKGSPAESEKIAAKDEKPLAAHIETVMAVTPAVDEKPALLRVNFENVDLKKAPGWNFSPTGNFDIVPEPGQGSVLRVRAKRKTDVDVRVEIAFPDLEKLRGRDIAGTVKVKLGAGVIAAANTGGGLGSHVGIFGHGIDGILYSQWTPFPVLTHEWQTVRFGIGVPQNAKEAYVRIEIQSGEGEVLIDDLTVDYSRRSSSTGAAGDNSPAQDPPAKKEGFKFKLPF